MSVTRPVVKTETLEKKNQTSLGINLPLESGQSERWYFHLGASNGISVPAEVTEDIWVLRERRLVFPTSDLDPPGTNRSRQYHE